MVQRDIRLNTAGSGRRFKITGDAYTVSSVTSELGVSAKIINQLIIIIN